MGIQTNIKNEAELQDWIQNRLDGGVKFLIEKEEYKGKTMVSRLLDSNGKCLKIDWQNELQNPRNHAK